MCGRFSITLPSDAMAQLFDATPANDLPSVPNYNVCPTNQVHVVANMGARRLVPMRWGLLPHWYKTPKDGPLLINARAETVADKPAFRTSVRERRCLIVATGFYEWTRDGDNRLPWYITRRDGTALVFAGIWREWNQQDTAIRTCAIVTTHANAAMSAIHNRMPVILDARDIALWLGEAGKGAATLMAPAPDDTLVWHRVAQAVNSNRAAGPELIEPLPSDA